MSEAVFKPLSGRGRSIRANREEAGWSLLWGSYHFTLTDSLVADILANFFVDPHHWYPLGASMTDPMPNGLGSFLRRRCPRLNPRQASLIAALMAKEQLLECRGLKPIELKRKF